MIYILYYIFSLLEHFGKNLKKMHLIYISDPYVIYSLVCSIHLICIYIRPVYDIYSIYWYVLFISLFRAIFYDFFKFSYLIFCVFIFSCVFFSCVSFFFLWFCCDVFGSFAAITRAFTTPARLLLYSRCPLPEQLGQSQLSRWRRRWQRCWRELSCWAWAEAYNKLS